jgi:hypothetical protein
MPVNVDQVTSDVVAESGQDAPATSPTPAAESPWLVLARHRALAKQAITDSFRTHAEAYDD